LPEENASQKRDDDETRTEYRSTSRGTCGEAAPLTRYRTMGAKRRSMSRSFTENLH
jgi:hypothetical protein